MASFSNIDGEEGSTVTFSVAAVSITRNSSVELQEILTIGDPDSSLALAAVTNAAPASTRWGLNVRVVGGPSSVADFSVRAVLPSTGADNPVSAAQASTVWAVQAAVSSVSGMVMVAAPSTANSSNYLPVRLTNSTAYIEPAVDYIHGTTITVSTVAGPTVMLRGTASTSIPAAVSTNAAGAMVTQWGTLNGAAYMAVVTDSGATIMDPTNSAMRVNIVASSATSTTVSVSSLAGSVTVAPISSSGVSMSTDADPASTKQGLIVRQVGYSTIVAVSSLAGAVITRSSAADQLVTVYQSSYSGLLARVQNSTIGDLLASVQQNSTVWQVQAKIQDSSAVGFVGSVTRPTTGAQGLLTRTILNDLQSTAFSTIGNNSTSSTIVSSVAAQRVKVYAYSITSTAQAINTLSFASSLASMIWTIQSQAISSGIFGANVAVSPPAWLFATAAADPLVFKVTGTTGTYHLSFSYFVEA